MLALHRTLLVLLSPAFLGLVAIAGAADAPRSQFPDAVMADKPIAYWRLNDIQPGRAANGAAPDQYNGDAVGNVQLQQPGPKSELFPDFEPHALAAAFSGGHIRVKDSAGKSVLKFGVNDAITLEAWVELKHIQDNQNMYILCKGRTHNKGFSRNNENYGFRLRGIGGTARVSFMFRGANQLEAGGESGWHRWNSDNGFGEKTGWHHVAVTYVFGDSKSIRGYVDGVEVKGTWDNGGPTNEAPVVDDDELWIGSSMGGNPASSFNGSIAEIAIHRAVLDSARIKTRYHATEDARKVAHNDGSNDPTRNDAAPPDAAPIVAEVKTKKVISSFELNAASLPPSLLGLDAVNRGVAVEIIDHVTSIDSDKIVAPDIETSYAETAMGFVCVPTKYDDKAQRADRGSPFVLRATAKIELPIGESKLLLRAFNATRLIVDGKEVATTPALKAGASGHNAVPADPKKLDANMRELRPGHSERLVMLQGGSHEIVLVAQIGGGKLRPEVGELSVSIAAPGKPFLLLSANPSIPLSDAAWLAYADTQRAAHFADDAKRRASADVAERAYWSARHKFAREFAGAPVAAAGKNVIDAWINKEIDAQKITPAPLVGDDAFIRRVSLDIIGEVPSLDQIRNFLADKSPDRRAKLIATLLADARWADNWVGYWQDVLAENPGIIKPQLNNTGPFRTWIHESFLDNKPMDRFATELIVMSGSVYGGAPAGFAMATENDAPMAEKASIVCKAFLAAEMRCARCHDAPHHKFEQKDLFGLAAMLKRAPQDVPKSSSIPGTDKDIRKLEVNVTLKPGTKVEPEFPFEHVPTGSEKIDPLPAELLRKPSDTREKLAALITSPRNTRFAQVIVNRLWKRYMGTGIVEPLDDWEIAKPSNPELLNGLAHMLIECDYDLKRVAETILNSNAYQREAIPSADKEAVKSRTLFASQTRRRMSAEQLADSLFAAAGKPFGAEELNFDVDSRENVDVFQNLGVPRRAWQFTSLSNERDRPALSLPVARGIMDMLVRFGWRESRQAPLSVRDEAPNVLQPAVLANGPAGNRVVRLSDDSAFTALCLENQMPAELLTRLYVRILSREPNEAERKMLLPLIEDGYAKRVIATEYAQNHALAGNSQVSWSNHLSPEATKIKMELEKTARLGEPPTKRLESAWRERMEDIIWSLVNSPEFVFIP